MLLLLIIILVLIGAAVVGSIYSNFLTFYSNFSETENYHKAYYAAISALERGELVVKQRSPGYEGKAGRYRNGSSRTGTGSLNANNGKSDGVISTDSFSYLSNNNRPSEMIRSVSSRTQTIPASGKGNVEFLLRYDSNDSNNSKNYNMMGYEDAEVFLLYYDNVNSNPYNKTSEKNCTPSNPSLITGNIRLPQKLLSDNFTTLDTDAILVGTNNQIPKDDAIVDRQIRGLYLKPGQPLPVSYTIYSTQKTRNNNKEVDYRSDTIFRESDINNNLKFKFENSWNPIQYTNTNYHGKDGKATIISQLEGDIKNLNFKKVFTNTQFGQNQLRFSLLNLIRDRKLKIYPFLEYQINFGTDVSDRYYTINGKGNFSDFEVNITRQKPTIKETVLGNFTSIF